MSFPSSTWKNSSRLFSRVTQGARSNFNRSYSQPITPQADNLYLSKKFGFSLPFDPEITMDQYLCSVGDLIGDKNIVFAGKNYDIVKFYLKTEALVQKVYDNHPQIVIGGKPFLVNKLVNNGYQVCLANVDPAVPDALLIEELSKYTKVVSQMKFLHLATRNERFSHVIGFRRSVCVDKIDMLPYSFNLQFENTSLKIFLYIEKVSCFKCKAEGHLKNVCPSQSSKINERLNQNIDTSASENTIEPFNPDIEVKSHMPPLLSPNTGKPSDVQLSKGAAMDAFVPSFSSISNDALSTPLPGNDYSSAPTFPNGHPPIENNQETIDANEGITVVEVYDENIQEH